MAFLSALSHVHALTALAVYLVLVNLIAFSLMGIDKRRARRGRFRIPETVFFVWAGAGGSIGAILGMRFFHHKTRKKAFSVGLPLILTAQIVLVLLLYGTAASILFS